MESKKCPVCGTLCTIEGDVTRHYEPVKPALRLPENPYCSIISPSWHRVYQKALDDVKELNKCKHSCMAGESEE